MSVSILEIDELFPCIMCGENLCYEKGYGPDFGLCCGCAYAIADAYWMAHAGEPLFPGATKVASRPRPVPAKLRWQVLREADYTCQSCGAKDRPMHVDHVVPRAKGGGNDRDNLQALCDKCNMAKGAT